MIYRNLTILVFLLFIGCSESTDISPLCVEPPGGEFDPDKMNLSAARATTSLLETVLDLDTGLYPVSEDTIYYSISGIVFFDGEEEFPSSNDDGTSIRYYSDFVQLEPERDFPGIRFMIEDQMFSFDNSDLLGSFPNDRQGVFIYSIIVVDFENNDIKVVVEPWPDYDGRCNDTIDITG